MKHFSLAATFGLLLVMTAVAQDPLVVAPQAYKMQFENDWVKVVSVRYGPREKVVAHDHTALPAAYVYLNDGGPVVFNHLDKAYGAVTRPATKAGSFRIYHGIQEIHTVENRGDVPSEFLRVEFKTEPKNENSLRGKFYREPYPAGENFQKIQFENEQVRVTRLACAAGKKLDVSTTPGEPTLLVMLSAANFKMSRAKGKTVKRQLALGQTEWLAVNQQAQVENLGGDHLEMLRFDFKTAPLSKEELEKKKPHVHPKN